MTNIKMRWADYCVSKLSLDSNGMISNIVYYEDYGNNLSSSTFEQNRNWMVQKVLNGKTFCSIQRNDKGTWSKIGDFSYNGTIFQWYTIPKNITRRKTFISYYHNDDQSYKEKFENLFEDLIVSKSVEVGDIDTDSSDEYIKQLIQKDYLADTTVLIVLVGPKTKCRKHVDWEISGAISTRVGGNSGLIGILLPSHPDYGADKTWNADNLPKRLAANIKSGYASLYDWTDDRAKMQSWIEVAFAAKSEIEKRITKSIPQMDKDTCE